MQTIPHSLSKDKNDAKAHWSLAEIEESIPSVRRTGYFPFFYNMDGLPVWLNAMYRGQSAFLLAGGPSVRELKLQVLSKCWVMTLNNAHTSFRGNAACMVDDPSRFSLSLWLDPTVVKFAPMSCFGKALWDNRLIASPRAHGSATPRHIWEPARWKVADCPNVIGYRRNEKMHPPRWLHEETINWGNHAKYGGGRSVMLAALRILFILGFRRVYLLGVDFEMSAQKRYHFAEERTPASIKGNMSTYAKLQDWFTALQPIFVKEKFIVKNCNPRSKLTAFPFMPFDDAVAEATALLGDFAHERSQGMYSKWEEKMAVIAAGTAQPGAR